MVANDCISKSNSPKSCPPNLTTSSIKYPSKACESGIDPPSKLLETSVQKSRQTRLLIKTDTSRLQKIGLNVNTNVHFKPKKRYDCMHFINEMFILLLTIYGIVSYLEIQSLKCEVQEMKLHLKVIEESIRFSTNAKSAVINAIEQEKENVLEEEKETMKHIVTKRETEIVEDAGRAGSNCSSNTRFARSVTRGPLALHLRGAMPEITARDGGVIAPWYVDKSSSGSFLLADGIVGERRGILEIAEEGLYYIYAQIYYLTSSSLNSYAINVQLADSRAREDSIVAVCSAEATVAKISELSCFTATVRYLRRGDKLYVTQRERNRRIIFRDNQTFLGLVLLNSHNPVNK